MLNLIPAMDAIKAKRQKLIEDKDREIQALDIAFKTLCELNEACLYCGGQGKKLRARACAEDDRPNPNDPNDWEICPSCKGTGEHQT